jgi:hypothetical protein
LEYRLFDKESNESLFRLTQLLKDIGFLFLGVGTAAFITPVNIWASDPYFDQFRY